MHGLSKAPEHLRTMTRYSGLVNGYGWTLHIHLKHGASHHSRSLLTDSLLQIRGHITTGYLRWVKYYLTLNESQYLQIRICIEHMVGMLKGTFQSLKEIWIQLINTKCHMIIIMWACVCIMLHNLIICIKGDNFDEKWRESLVRTGRDLECTNNNSGEDNEAEDALERVQWQIETPGQCFRLQLMDDLSNSPFCAIERRP